MNCVDGFLGSGSPDSEVLDGRQKRRFRDTILHRSLSDDDDEDEDDDEGHFDFLLRLSSLEIAFFLSFSWFIFRIAFLSLSFRVLSKVELIAESG